MRQTKVSLVIPTLGARIDWLALVLRSVRHQDVEVDLAVVGPEQANLRELCALHGAKLILEDKRGLSAAINQGFASTDGSTEFFAWIGDDDILAPGSLAATVSALEIRLEAPFAFGRVRYIDASGETKWLLRPGSWSVPYARWGRNFIPQPGSLIRRASWSEIGGLDESLRNAMDQDLFLKLAELGSPVYVPQEVAAFRVHGGSISVVKGTQDESKHVQERYRREVPRAARPILDLVITLADRVLLSVHSRVPGPRAPYLNGVPYTKEPRP